MRLFLLYEAACVVACTSIAIGTAREYGSALANWHTVWQVRMGAYWSMTLFGLLCVPYLVCCAPVVNVVVSQTTPTGYDRCGRCRWRLTVFQLETRRYIQQLSEDHDQHDDTPAEKKKHSGWMGSFDPRSMRIVRRFLPKRLL
uniref:Uncharacterized protein n=1 Tax=Chrysotila carterae TaxID=13221 RepID=A0A6S9QUQ5_CHRCT|mmetsp:Transcript_4432/g.9689  ORF Transcript_4432/g.9689 Transcript_4432/m.9689 type:complete len:143 (+) Transcript_4432:423-851(+)